MPYACSSFSLCYLALELNVSHEQLQMYDQGSQHFSPSWYCLVIVRLISYHLLRQDNWHWIRWLVSIQCLGDEKVLVVQVHAWITIIQVRY